MLLNRTVLGLNTIYNWFQPMDLWVNWGQLQICGSENDKRTNFWPTNCKLPWKCQLSASRELAQGFTGAIAKA